MSTEERLAERRETRIAAGRAAFAKLSDHEHFRDWLAVADALVAIREEAMDHVHTNRPQGPPYRAALKAIRTREPWTEKLDSATTTACYWLIDNLAAVQAWREMLTFKQRDEWNHPATVRRAYERLNTVKDPKLATAPSPIAAARQLAGQLQEENDKLRRELARAKDEGSLFNLAVDSADDIARVIIAHVTDNKAEAIAKGLRDGVKARQTRKRHAG